MRNGNDGDGDHQVYILEVNPRASRTIPFISKVTGLPVASIGTKVMLGRTLAELGYSGGLWKRQRVVGNQGAGVLNVKADGRGLVPRA